MATLYSWHPARRASRRAIGYFLDTASAKKAWAHALPLEWFAKASSDALRMARDYMSLSLRQLARRDLEYARHRAGLGFAAHGTSWDRPAVLLWSRLNDVDPLKWRNICIGEDAGTMQPSEQQAATPYFGA